FRLITRPLQLHDKQAPWPNDVAPIDMPLASRVLIIQLGYAAWLMTTLNFFILGAARKHLAHDPALQEKVVAAFLYALAFGDFAHIAISLWAFGDIRWEFSKWTSLMKTALILGLSLLIPRVCWYLGIGRYVRERDGLKQTKGE